MKLPDFEIKFKCIGCGYCCKCEPGFVFLGKKDIEMLKNEFNQSFDTLLEKYLRVVNVGEYYQLSLLEKSNNECIFLENNKCSIYNNRPIQCRTYPFWPQIISSKENYLKEKDYCPGIGNGKIVENSVIEAKLNRRFDNSLVLLKKDFKYKKYEKNHRSNN